MEGGKQEATKANTNRGPKPDNKAEDVAPESADGELANADSTREIQDKTHSSRKQKGKATKGRDTEVTDKSANRVENPDEVNLNQTKTSKRRSTKGKKQAQDDVDGFNQSVDENVGLLQTNDEDQQPANGRRQEQRAGAHS